MDPRLPHTQPNEHLYVGEIVREPHFTDIIRPSYGLRVRPVENQAGRSIQSGPAEVVLATGETLPVTVIGFGAVHPLPSAVQSGSWAPEDQSIFIEASDLTAEQARQARRFRQRQTASN